MALPTFEDWSATWDAKHPEFDAEKAKKLIYNLERDKETLRTEKSTVTTERDELKAKVDRAESANLSDVERLTKELEEIKKNPPKPLNKVEIILAKAAEEGLSIQQTNAASRYVSGDTAEEVEVNFAKYCEDHKIGKTNGTEQEGGGKGKGPRTRTEVVRNRVTGVDKVDDGGSDDDVPDDPGALLDKHRAER